MYHSITFTRKDLPNVTANTWDTWRLIPTSRPLFAVPKMKTNFVEVPGASGSLDLSKALTPYPLYGDRTGSLEFAVSNDFWPWQKMHETLLSFFHGQTLLATLEDDPDYYYEGLFTVAEWKSNNDGTWSTVKLDYTCQPYKLSKRHAYEIYSSKLRFINPKNVTKYVTVALSTLAMMPTHAELSIYSALGTGMAIGFKNEELGINLSQVQYQGSGTEALDGSADGEYIVIPDSEIWYPAEAMLITNMSGSNTIQFRISGKGVVSIDFKIGRL